MKRQVLTLAILFVVAATISAADAPGQKKKSDISFTENKGQVHDLNHTPRPDVLYGAMAGNMAVHIKNSGVSYQLYRTDKSDGAPVLTTRGERSLEKEASQKTVYRIDLNWLNHNPNFTKSEEGLLPGYSNYYSESCPNGALRVKSYKDITLHNLYQGIDLHYYEKNGELKHDYIVAPHTYYKQIRVKVEGADVIVNADGSLLLSTPLGKIQEGAPVVYQNSKQLKATWQIENNILSFDIENYNPAFELIIDPVTRLWSTYYGAEFEYNGVIAGSTYGNFCNTDASGNVYLTGTTAVVTTTLLATNGSHQSVYGGYDDAFLAKFNSAGIRQWATFYGASNNESGESCAADPSGNVYMAGAAKGSSVIATNNSHQPAFGGGVEDAYLVKFDPNGVRLWATYYGGPGSDSGESCTTDAAGNVYMSGMTNSGSGMSSPNGHQPVFGGNGYLDAFLVKFDSNGNRLWATYYGDSMREIGWCCKTDASGNVYMSGETSSNTSAALVTTGCHQPLYGAGTNGADNDAFLVKFDSNGNRLWATYYGGTLNDVGYSCATDAAGNVFMAGEGRSTTGTVIATSGSHQSTSANGAAFLVKFDAAGTRQWGTYYGVMTGGDLGYVCGADANGNVYLGAHTTASNLIPTPGCFQSAFGGGNMDACLVKFSPGGVRQWGTYFGGTGVEFAFSIAVDASGDVYMAGSSGSDIGIASPGAHQDIFYGTIDAYLVKFSACDAPAQPVAINGNTMICANSGANSYNTPPVAGATSYSWSLPGGWTGSSTTTTISATPGASGVFTVIAKSPCGVSMQRTVSVTVDPCTGINSQSLNQAGFKLYPNPVKETLYLESESDHELLVMNTIGQIVYSSELSAGSHALNLEHLAKGIYIVELRNSSGSEKTKIVKE